MFLVQSIHDRSINHVLKKVNMHAMSEEERDAAMKEVCGVHDRPMKEVYGLHYRSMFEKSYIHAMYE